MKCDAYLHQPIEGNDNAVEQTTKKKSVFWQLLNICPYTHLIRVIKTAAKERKFPNPTAKQGATIMIIGILCPIFWISLISGASADTLRFNAIHSGIFAMIGFVLMIAGFLKKTK